MQSNFFIIGIHDDSYYQWWCGYQSLIGLMKKIGLDPTWNRENTVSIYFIYKDIILCCFLLIYMRVSHDFCWFFATRIQITSYSRLSWSRTRSRIWTVNPSLTPSPRRSTKEGRNSTKSSSITTLLYHQGCTKFHFHFWFVGGGGGLRLS